MGYLALTDAHVAWFGVK
ncbi:hypothetical protein VCBJG01_0253, partial [Vibrio cholerae BJG-01]